MRIKGSFVMRDIAGDIVIVPIGDSALSYNGMITTTKTGAELWKALEKGCDRDSLIQILLERFDVDYETASADTDKFLADLVLLGLIEEDSNHEKDDLKGSSNQ